MKKILIALNIALLSLAVQAAEPVYAKTTPNPVVVPEDAPKAQKVCIDKITKDGKPVLGKDGKPQQDCKMMKVHKKLEGTQVPPKK